ncbi:hypothetical protein Tco_1235906 [Tanacetum coccineum]
MSSYDRDVCLYVQVFVMERNYGVTCEEEAKRRNSGAKTKTFEENTHLTPYAVSIKEDTAYQHQLTNSPPIEITSDSESECEGQEPLSPILKLIRAKPACTLNSLLSLANLTLNMTDLTLDTSVTKKTKPTSDKVSPAYVHKKKTESKSHTRNYPLTRELTHPTKQLPSSYTNGRR